MHGPAVTEQPGSKCPGTPVLANAAVSSHEGLSDADVNEFVLLVCGLRRMFMFPPNCERVPPLDPRNIVHEVVHRNLIASGVGHRQRRVVRTLVVV